MMWQADIRRQHTSLRVPLTSTGAGVPSVTIGALLMRSGANSHQITNMVAAPCHVTLSSTRPTHTGEQCKRVSAAGF
jgi:hypothetical protein